ncbi:hypothetical protein BDR06DRAFT_960171 [Suillus hirtellus]|nr:hypothetical protein BDR06DRAFT_960171 [Suillus hirtellus]
MVSHIGILANDAHAIAIFLGLVHITSWHYNSQTVAERLKEQRSLLNVYLITTVISNQAILFIGKLPTRRKISDRDGQ